MQRLLIWSAILMLCLHAAYSSPQSLHIRKRHAYNGPSQAALTKFEQMNVDAILKSDRLLTNYVECLLEKGKCSKSAEELKSVLPGLIASKCLHCTPQQRAKVVKVMTHLSVHKPDAWKKLKEKYAPKTNLAAFGLKAKRNINKT